MKEKEMERVNINKQFEKLNEKSRSQLEKELRGTVVELFQKEEMGECFYKYEAKLQNAKFLTYMTNEELEELIKLTIDLLEELKVTNNSGMIEAEFRKKVTEMEKKHEDEFMRNLYTWEILCSENIRKIIVDVDCVRRVGGAYAMFISNPVLKNAIYVVYDRIVDEFDDESIYWHSAFFLLRAIMMMRSETIRSQED